MVREMTKKVAVIQDHILAAQSRQKNYADKRRRTLEFEVGYFVMLKVSPMKDVKRFGRKGKLTPRYIRSFKIFERVGVVSYCLELPATLKDVHDVLHLSMLRKYLRDEEQLQVMPLSELQLQLNAITAETPLCILAKEDKKLRNKIIPLVKVQWSRRGVEEASWGREKDMRRDYHNFLTRRSNTSSLVCK